MIFIKQYLITLTFIVIAVWVMPANTQRGTLSVLCTVLYEFGHLKKQYEGIYKNVQDTKDGKFTGVLGIDKKMKKLKSQTFIEGKPTVQREAERKKLDEEASEKLKEGKRQTFIALSGVFRSMTDNYKKLEDIKKALSEEEEKAKQRELKSKKLDEEATPNNLKEQVKKLDEIAKLRKEQEEEEEKAKHKEENLKELRRQQTFKEVEEQDEVKQRELRRVFSGTADNYKTIEELKKEAKEVKQRVKDLEALQKEQIEKTLKEIKNILTEIAENEHIANNAEIINFNAKISTTKDVDKVLRNLTLNFASYIKEIEREMVCPSVQDFCCARTESTNHIDFYKSIFDISVNT